MCQSYAGRTFIGQVMTTHAEAILAEADLQTVATRATQITTMAMAKSLRLPGMNWRMQIFTAEVCHRTKETS